MLTDIWTGRELGQVSGAFSRSLVAHASGLLKSSGKPVK